MASSKQTRRNQFENLPEKLPASVSLFPDTPEHAQTLDGTLIDISSKSVCIRIPMNQQGTQVMREASEGDPIRARIEHSRNRRWHVSGHVAWIWLPRVEGKDLIGSLGINIADITEDDQRLLGRIKRFFRSET